MIDYKIEHFEKFKDQRGDLVVFLRKRELESKFQKFGQIYFVTFDKKGIIRANHYHKKLREWFGVVSGRVQVKLRDVKTGKEKVLELDANSSDYIRLEIGPMVAHAFKSLTPFASVVNYTDQEWTKEDVFPVKILV